MTFTIYAGLAGDTDAGRFLSTGLFRSCRVGEWERAEDGFHAPPQVRALLADPNRPGEVFAGTQDGIYRSTDHGDTWNRMDAPTPEMAVWSLARHPVDPDTLYAGYESAAILRSVDGGSTWTDLDINVSYPSITRDPRSPKRITHICLDPGTPERIYASIEVGGLIGSDDAGQTWNQILDGLYVADDSMDMHSVVVSAEGEIIVATRNGTFRSADHAMTWERLEVPVLSARGTYCRVLGLGSDQTIFVGGGTDFDGDIGGLFVSRDGGREFAEVDLTNPLKSAIFSLDIDPGAPERMVCSDKFGQVFTSDDSGSHWQLNALPKGIGHVYSIAIG